MSEELYIKPGDPKSPCWAHNRPIEGLYKILIDEMRLTHGKGGVNVCIECIHRIKAHVDTKR